MTLECFRVERRIAELAGQHLFSPVSANDNRLVVFLASELDSTVLAPVVLFLGQQLDLGRVSRESGCYLPGVPAGLDLFAKQDSGSQHLEAVTPSCPVRNLGYLVQGSV